MNRKYLRHLNLLEDIPKAEHPWGDRPNALFQVVKRYDINKFISNLMQNDCHIMFTRDPISAETVTLYFKLSDDERKYTADTEQTNIRDNLLDNKDWCEELDNDYELCMAVIEDEFYIKRVGAEYLVTYVQSMHFNRSVE